MNTNSIVIAAMALGLTAIAGGAQAQDADRWFFHVGPAALILDEKAEEVRLGGAVVPGANVKIDPQYTVEAEIGYFLTENVAVAFAGGAPPKAKVDATGSMAPLGRAGEMTYGPATLTAQYHFARGERFQPYVGAGLTFMVVFDTDDGALSDLDVDSSIGTALQAGANFWLTKRAGVFVDVKKAFLDTKATGTLGGTPVEADVRLDPLVVNAGLALRF